MGPPFPVKHCAGPATFRESPAKQTYMIVFQGAIDRYFVSYTRNNHPTMEKHKNHPGHLLDGTQITYTYENGSSVKVHFDKGRFYFKWLSGPFQGAQGDEEYKSLKIAEKIFVVNIFMPNKTFVTLIFNFQARTMCASVLFTPGAETEMVLFESGVIDHLVH